MVTKEWVFTRQGPLPDWWYELCQRAARRERKHDLFMADIKGRDAGMIVFGALAMVWLLSYMAMAIFEPFGSSDGVWKILLNPDGFRECALSFAMGVVTGAVPFLAGRLARHVTYRWLARRIPPLDWYVHRECEQVRREEGEEIDRWFQRDATRPFDAPVFDIPYRRPPV